MFQNVAMTSHIGKKSGLVPAASVTTATPAPGKGSGHSPSPFYGGHMASNPNHDPPPPFLFVDSLKAIEIVVSFTALSKWLDAPQPIIKERDKEKEKESNSTLTGQGMAISLNYLFPFLSCFCHVARLAKGSGTLNHLKNTLALCSCNYLYFDLDSTFNNSCS